MLSSPHGSGFFAGNWELLGEVFGGGIFTGREAWKQAGRSFSAITLSSPMRA
jgi:hypothetical protein